MKSRNYFEDIKFHILLAEYTQTSIKKMSANRIFNSNKEEGTDFEFIYSLQDNYLDEVMRLHVGQSMSFLSNRDASWRSVIVRVE